jgi:hypothetical protein
MPEQIHHGFLQASPLATFQSAEKGNILNKQNHWSAQSHKKTLINLDFL